MTGDEQEAMKLLMEKNEQLSKRYIEAETFILEFFRYGFLKKIRNFHKFHEFLREALHKYKF